MTPNVFLRDVVEAMDLLTPDPRSYINRHTGELLKVSEVELAAVVEGVELHPDCDRQAVVKLHEVLDSENWLPFPVRYTVQEIDLMARFASAVTQRQMRDDLLQSVWGPDPLMRFSDALDHWRLRDEYFHFREQELSRLAEGWLQAYGIAYRK